MPYDENDRWREPNNDDRAGWGLLALGVFAQATRYGPEDWSVDATNAEELREVLGDLLCDLRHLCDMAGVSYMEADLFARGNYVEEVLEEALPLPRPDASGTQAQRDAVEKLDNLSQRVSEQLLTRRKVRRAT